MPHLVNSQLRFCSNHFSEPAGENRYDSGVSSACQWNDCRKWHSYISLVLTSLAITRLHTTTVHVCTSVQDIYWQSNPRYDAQRVFASISFRSLSLCLFVCLSISVSVCLSVCLSLCCSFFGETVEHARDWDHTAELHTVKTHLVWMNTASPQRRLNKHDRGEDLKRKEVSATSLSEKVKIKPARNWKSFLYLILRFSRFHHLRLYGSYFAEHSSSLVRSVSSFSWPFLCTFLTILYQCIVLFQSLQWDRERYGHLFDWGPHIGNPFSLEQNWKSGG